MATKWINTNGGAWETASNWDNGVPSTTNQAIFDAASFAANGKVVTIGALAQCQGLDASAADQTFTISSAVYGLELYGDFVGSTNCTFAMTGTAYVYSKATQTITTNGKTLGWNKWYIDGTGITVTNVDSLSIGATYLTNGTWNTNNQDILITSSFVTNAGTKTLSLGSSLFRVYDWYNGSSTNFTFNPGTSTVQIESTGGILAAITFYNLKLIGLYSVSATVSIYANITISNNLTITGANATSQRILIQSNTIGTPRTITCNGTTNITNCDFQDITLAGTANRDFSAQTDIGNCGGNSGITFPPAIDCYIKHTSGAMSVSNVAKWVTTDGGSTQARVPLPQDRAWGVASSFTGAATVTMDCPRIGSIDFSAINQALSLARSTAVSIYGNFILSSLISYGTDTGYYFYLYGKGVGIASNLNTYGTNYTQQLYVNRGNYTLLTNLNSGIINVGNQVVFDCNGYAFNVGKLSSSGTPTIYLKSATHTIYGISEGLLWQISVGTILYPGTSTIKFTANSGTSNITFDGVNKSYYNLWFSGNHLGNYDITYSNTFNQIKIDAGRKVRCADNSTQQVASLEAVGTAAAPITLSGVTSAGFTLNYTGSKWIQCDWLNLTNVRVTPINRWFAGKNSVNGGGNTNWLFKRYILTPIITLIRRI